MSENLNKIDAIEESKRLLEAGDAMGASELLKLSLLEFPEDNEIGTMLGGALFYSNQFIDSEKLLRNILKQSSDNKEVWAYYYRSLRRQGKLIDCIGINRSTSSEFPDDPFFYGESFAALGLTGNITELLSNEPQYKISDAKGLCWLVAAYQSEANHAMAVKLMANEGALVSQDIILQQLLLRSIGYTVNGFDEAYKKYALIVGNDNNKVWAHYELSRYLNADECIVLHAKSERPFNVDPTPYCPKVTGYSKVDIDNNIVKKECKTPVINQEDLKLNINKLISVIRFLQEDGVFDNKLVNIDAVRKQFAPEAKDPVQLLSTGRCGTIGFYKLLCRSKNVLPYHTLGWQMIPGDRNHMLYRILTQKFDQNVLIRIFTDYLESRVAEMMYAYRLGRTPVIINHWDTIFSPLWSVIFPESTFLHLYRSDEKVFESLYTKNQFQNEQLHYCQFDENFPNGNFHIRYDNRPIEEEIAWYLTITREFSSALMNVLGDERTTSIASEDLFRASKDDYYKLQKIFPLHDVSYKEYFEHYSQPINTKPEKRQSPDGWLESKRCFNEAFEQLRKHGKFS